MVVFTLLFGLVIIIVLYYRWIFFYWERKNVKTIKPNLLFGNLTDVILKKVPLYLTFQKIYKTCVAKNEKYMGFYIFAKPGLVVVDLELIKSILGKDFNSFTDRLFYKNKKVDFLSVNIFSAEGEEWRAKREKLTPAFSPKKLKTICGTLTQVGESLKIVLDQYSINREPINLSDIANKYIVDGVGVSVFGIECNTLSGHNLEFNHYIQKIVGGSILQCFKFFISLTCPAILHFFNIPFFTADVQNFFMNLTKTTIEERETNGYVKNDFMQLFIQLRNNINIEKEADPSKLETDGNGPKALTIEEIASETVIYFAASYETVSSAIIFLVYELSKNTNCEETLRNEIFDVLQQHNGEITYDSISEMTYLDKCVNEILRKYPSLGILTRICCKPYHVPNTSLVIEKGTIVYIPISSIHQDPRYYPNPEEFDPERFSTENKQKRLASTFLSFGYGPRSCIGYRLGLMYIKMFITTLYYNYNVTLSSKNTFPLKFDENAILMAFKGSIYFDINNISK